MQNLRLIDFGFFVEVDSYHLEPIKVQYFAQLMYHEVKLAVDFLACVAVQAVEGEAGQNVHGRQKGL